MIATVLTPSAARKTYTTLARAILAAERLAEDAAPAAVLPSLARLSLTDTTAHTGGALLLALAPPPGASLLLSARDLSAGDPVSVATPAGPVQATVWRITREHVVLAAAADALPDDPAAAFSPHVSLARVADGASYARQAAALGGIDGARRHPVVDVLFGATAPAFDEALGSAASDFAAKCGGEGRYRLNAEQREALRRAVAASSVALVHGPPGTGKTSTLAAAVHACVRVRGERVLACAPSNVAADGIVEALVRVDPGLRVVRVGSLVRLRECVLERSLDEMVLEEFGGVGRQIRRDVSVAQRVLWGRAGREEKNEARERLRELRKEEKRRERDAVLFVLERADVVVTTCIGAGGRRLRGMRGATAGAAEAGREPDIRYPFDVVFVDESANATESAAWCAMLLGRRVVLAGDNKQLPPVVIMDDGDLRMSALNLTAFERAKTVLGEDVVFLRRQFRMHQVIGQFASEVFYNGSLIHDESCKDGDLKSLVDGRGGCSGSDFAEDVTHPLIFIDTVGCDYFEETESGLVAVDKFSSVRKSGKAGKGHGQKHRGGGNGEKSEDDSTSKVHDSGSRLNAGEATLAVAHCRNFVEKCGVFPEEIACISPYSAQCQRIRKLMDEAGLQGVEVGTVDGLQGREKEVIIFSATRSSEMGGTGGIGFLAETRRFNVALLILTGDESTWSLSRSQVLDFRVDMLSALGSLLEDRDLHYIF